jgi:hypothetical protein
MTGLFNEAMQGGVKSVVLFMANQAPDQAPLMIPSILLRR